MDDGDVVAELTLQDAVEVLAVPLARQGVAVRQHTYNADLVGALELESCAHGAGCVVLLSVLVCSLRRLCTATILGKRLRARVFKRAMPISSPFLASTVAPLQLSTCANFLLPDASLGRLHDYRFPMTILKKPRYGIATGG